MEWWSLGALGIVIVLSCFTKVNPGLVALALAWALGFLGAHMTPLQIAAGFPVQMLLILVGVTYLFGLAKHNGTLEKISQSIIKIVRHNAFSAPLLFFVLAFALSTCGAGNIGSVALLAPIAMAVAWETGIGAFFMTILLICGANAGAFSPLAFTGIIANALISKIGLVMHPWRDVFLPNFYAETLLAAFAFAILYFRRKTHKIHTHRLPEIKTLNEPWSLPQIITIIILLNFIIVSIVFKTDIGFLAISLGCLLSLFNVSDNKETIKQMPWNTIIMVCGVNTLIGIIEQTGGLNLLTHLMAKIANPSNVTAVTAFTTGVLSTFSSSSGVVLPAFIPLVPGLIQKIGGGNPTSIVSSINVGAHLVDISPLSSLGALCLASALYEDKEKLFRQLLIFGISMVAFGTLLCFILFK